MNEDRRAFVTGILLAAPMCGKPKPKALEFIARFECSRCRHTELVTYLSFPGTASKASESIHESMICGRCQLAMERKWLQNPVSPHLEVGAQ